MEARHALSLTEDARAPRRQARSSETGDVGHTHEPSIKLVDNVLAARGVPPARLKYTPRIAWRASRLQQPGRTTTSIWSGMQNWWRIRQIEVRPNLTNRRLG